MSKDFKPAEELLSQKGACTHKASCIMREVCDQNGCWFSRMQNSVNFDQLATDAMRKHRQNQKDVEALRSILEAFRPVNFKPLSVLDESIERDDLIIMDENREPIPKEKTQILQAILLGTATQTKYWIQMGGNEILLDVEIRPVEIQGQLVACVVIWSQDDGKAQDKNI